MDNRHGVFMQRCLELAQRGAGKTWSNPMVGCVIVHNDQIISEGWHEKYGEAHAERNAILKIAGDPRLRSAVLYVNLEPCSHQGKTPPCANLIVEHQIPTLVYGIQDPNAEVNGKGLAFLQKNGVTVIGPVLEKECQWLNRRFVVFHTQKRSYIILKWAQTADGFMAPENGERFQISGEAARILLHQWRSKEMAVLVGAGTVAADKPELTVRFWEGETAYRIFLDGSLKNTYTSGLGKTLVYNRMEKNTRDDIEKVLVKGENMLPEILQDLYERKINSILVEGGYKTLQSFLELGVWDEIRVIESKKIHLDHGLKAPRPEGIKYREMDLDLDTVTFYTR